MTMEHGLTNLDILSRRYANAVLVHMLNKGKIKFSDLSDIVTSFSTLNNLMNDLESNELIIIEKTTKPYKTNYAELTELGTQVAKKLKEIQILMNGTNEEPEEDYVKNHKSSIQNSLNADQKD